MNGGPWSEASVDRRRSRVRDRYGDTASSGSVPVVPSAASGNEEGSGASGGEDATVSGSLAPTAGPLAVLPEGVILGLGGGRPTAILDLQRARPPGTRNAERAPAASWRRRRRGIQVRSSGSP